MRGMRGGRCAGCGSGGEGSLRERDWRARLIAVRGCAERALRLSSSISTRRLAALLVRAYLARLSAQVSVKSKITLSVTAGQLPATRSAPYQLLPWLSPAPLHPIASTTSVRDSLYLWSKINIDKVAALIEAGRMQAPGHAQIQAAKADGRWAKAYDGARTSAVPPDLLVALEAEPRAKAFFATINASNRYAVLWRIQTAVKAETRAKRMTQLVEMLARGETIHFFKAKTKA
jgi:hypothetical protein